MDIIVTTPKSQMANAANEAADCIGNGGGEYFRRFPMQCYPVNCRPGDRVYYVEDGFICGFATVDRCGPAFQIQRCDTTGRHWPPGYYLFMRADSWKWIRPIPLRGFQGFRYARSSASNPNVIEQITHDGKQLLAWVEIVGGWRDPRPEVRK